MTTATGLHYLPLHELARRIQSKDVSSAEVTSALLERIERLNPKLNAFITVMAESALADARAADDEIAAGNYRGPLHGVPIGVKDLCATKGVRTTAGSKIMADNVPDEDATVVRKLREAGAVIIGKTHMHEFAFGATGVNDHYGPARNPWDTERITGGSSSGSGAAVAAGLCYAALGSDTGGSIRIPASLCGIAGLKQTYGRVSLHGVVPLAWSLDHVGPMARTVRDCALVLTAIAGRDPKDPSTTDEPVEDWAADLDDGLAGLRIGVPTAYAFERTEPDVAALVHDAIATLERLGAEVQQLDLPILEEYWTNATQVLLGEAAAFHRENMEQRPQDYGENVRPRIQLGLDMKVTDYVDAARYRDEARRTCDAVLLSDVDLLAMPATRTATVPIDSVAADDPTVGLTLFTAPFDLTGQPAISVPCGFTEQGLPVGLQLVGRRFDERTVLRAAHAFETESGESSRHPPVD
ncbi:MAG: Asp-tRNA(Asn)/Glu-tRNA(Gln) amidotransferase subunit GatA [Chloroflexi bacterium]|nr:Asp-tRNA(Asn)/Glu-tRNA(Gln) amidotransferase subunit GatA [Chloroflexota bacterium]